MNLGPLAKALHGVNWRSPQSEGACRKQRSSRLWTQSSDDHIRGSQDALPSEHEAHSEQVAVWQHCVYLEREYEKEVLENQVHACWSKTPGSARKDMWPGHHIVTPNLDYEWHWVGQCRRSQLKWLGVPNEHLVEKSFPRSPFGHLITESNRKGSRIRRRCPGTKRVPGQSRFTLRCHKHD